MERELTAHVVPGAGSDLRILVMDPPGAGGASHRYNVFAQDGLGAGERLLIAQVAFQQGPIGEFGQNGLTHEALLAIIIHRLESFQAGPYSCVENAQALEHATAALEALKARTAARVARQVEGTSTV